jgi:hypothetical protein
VQACARRQQPLFLACTSIWQSGLTRVITRILIDLPESVAQLVEQRAKALGTSSEHGAADVDRSGRRHSRGASNKARSRPRRTSSRRKRTKAVRSGVGSWAAKPQTGGTWQGRPVPRPNARRRGRARSQAGARGTALTAPSPAHPWPRPRYPQASGRSPPSLPRPPPLPARTPRVATRHPWPAAPARSAGVPCASPTRSRQHGIRSHRDLGAGHFDRRNKHAAANRLITKLATLVGYEVSFTQMPARPPTWRRGVSVQGRAALGFQPIQSSRVPIRS